MEQKKHHTHLSLAERRQIYQLLSRKASVCRIAQELGRHHSTIYREIQRNAYFDHEEHNNNGYYPLNAQEYYRRRRQGLQLLVRSPKLKAFVIAKLRSFWSPDQIAGYLKRLGIEGFYACMETIYRFVYSDEGRKLRLSQYLFNRRRNRRKMHGRKPRSPRIPEHHGIAFRPDIVRLRSSVGHWEADLMIFNREHGKVNLTSMIKRKSRYTILAKNENRRPSQVIGTIRDQLMTLPDDLTQTVTFDRGLEFMSYPLLYKSLGMKSYFCDPQSPWQKGSVESNNNRIRRFLPRETDLNAFSNTDLVALSDVMNNTPRKCLSYRTPKEVFDEHLHLAA